jgi:hypothetical protein
MKLGLSGVALFAGFATLGVTVALAQAGRPAMTFADPPHKNLKILPRDMPRAELLGTMKFFSQSLGVRCTFCHVGEEGKPLSTFDFASDAKSKKQTARAMLAMVTVLNAKTLPEATGLPDAKVTCFTCHRGSTKPLTAPPPPETPPAPAPVKPPERG